MINSERLDEKVDTPSQLPTMEIASSQASPPIQSSSAVPRSSGVRGLAEGHEQEEEIKKDKDHNLVYGIEDIPPWYMCIVLGFQHYLTSFGATIGNPLIVTPAMCMFDDVARSEVIGTIFFISGLVTVLQCTFGVRLPLVQGGTFTFVTPIFAILSLPQWQCPDMESIMDVSSVTTPGSELPTVSTQSALDNSTDDPEIWKSRMREIQGAIIVASLFQVLIGITGIVGLMLRYIGPLAIAPTVTLTGLALFKVAASYCEKHWGIAVLTIGLLALFSQYLRNVEIPTSHCSGKTRSGLPIFKLFPVIFAILLSWGFCAILTAAGVFPDDPAALGYGARTDTKLDVIKKASWINVPYPGQWGLPTVSTAGVFGMLAGVLAGMFESIGDYYACARLAGAPPPPTHAINRGITVEGVGCVLAGLFGTGSGTTSYSENVGAIGITKVGSRMVIITGGLLMMVFGMLGKFGALFVTIPDPVIGGVFMVMFGMITAVGVSNLQFVDLNSSRNYFVFGFSVFFGLSLPHWISMHEGIINTGSDIADQIITVLLTTSMFVGGFIAFFLDNTIPGTAKERGLHMWISDLTNKDAEETQETMDSQRVTLSTYDFPFCMNKLRTFKFTQWIPICPTFIGFSRRGEQVQGVSNGSNINHSDTRL